MNTVFTTNLPQNTGLPLHGLLGTPEAAKSQGAVASIEGYSISDHKPDEAAARDKTIENARPNAADMASAAGVSLRRAIDIEDYGFPNVRINEPLGLQQQASER